MMKWMLITLGLRGGEGRGPIHCVFILVAKQTVFAYVIWRWQEIATIFGYLK